ncbi:hypothetical protein [Streptomyces sp. NPDC058614]|uniref:hypothetical protein n=1 Tax=Streptomyces sp. NPDC058614 TaxID=3346557 RepID=UPI00365434F0
MGREITELRALPDRAPAMRMMPTGQTIADAWYDAPDDAARREILTGYDVRVTLHPASAPQRVHITGASLLQEEAA